MKLVVDKQFEHGPFDYRKFDEVGELNIIGYSVAPLWLSLMVLLQRKHPKANGIIPINDWRRDRATFSIKSRDGAPER